MDRVYWVTIRRVQTNIQSLSRELSGPRPLCRVADIVSKQRVWNRNTSAQPECFNLTKCPRCLYISLSSFASVRRVKGIR